MDYIPSWINGAKTLLEKINKCIDKIEEYIGKTDNHTQSIASLTTAVGQNTTDIATNAENISNLNSDVNVLESSKQDALTAGENISIVNNVISASGGSGGKLYSHECTYNGGDSISGYFTAYLLFLSSKSTAFTSGEEVANAAFINGYTKDSQNNRKVVYLTREFDPHGVGYIVATFPSGALSASQIGGVPVSDTVREL